MMDAMDIQAVESKLNDVTVTAIPMTTNHHQQTQPHNYSTNQANRHYQASKPLHQAHQQNHHHHSNLHQQTSSISFQPAVPQPAHQSSFKQQHQQQQYHQQYHSPSSPHISIVPTSQLSPAITATRIPAPASPADYSTPVSLTVTSLPAVAGNGTSSSASGLTKYAQLLSVIEEMGRDIRPTYSGSRSSAERLKRGIVHARLLVRDCLVETERSGRQN